MADKSTRLPASQYKAEYPFNQTTVTRSGHEFHVDDTPGHERIRHAHKSGTYFEVSQDGRKVELVVANEYKYIKGGLTLTIDNNSDIRVAGNMRLVVEGDLHAEVHGDMTSVVSGDSSSAILGDSVSMIGGDSYSKVDGSATTKVDGNMNSIVGGDAEVEVAGNMTSTVTGDIALEGNMIRLEAKKIITLKSPRLNIVKG